MVKSLFAGRTAVTIVCLALLFSGCSFKRGQAVRGQEQAPQFKSGFNLMSPQQDVAIGRQNAQQVEKEMRVIADPIVQNYINSVGRKLAAVAPGEKFPYQFKVVDVKEINAFALPGGFLYVHSGAILAARNESELAGVMAHEISHAALRHGTHQMSQQMVAEKGFSIAAAIFGGDGTSLSDQALGALASGGMQLAFLKFSRTAEKEADISGAEILASAGYDPRGLINFFKTLLADSARPPQILSDHPDPGNRVQYLNDLLPKLKIAPNPVVDTPEFEQVKAKLKGLPGGRSLPRQSGPSQPLARPQAPSPEFVLLQAPDKSYTLTVPANWKVINNDPANLILAPDGAAGKTQTGLVVTHGMFVGLQELPANLRDNAAAAKAFIQLQLKDNPEMRVLDNPKQTTLSGIPAIYTPIGGDSPVTGRAERDVICTAVLPDGKLFYLVLISPVDEAQVYNQAFQKVLETLRIGN